MKGWKVIFLSIILVIGGLLADAYFIEPNRLINNEVTIKSNNASNQNKQLKIVQFSDLHVRKQTTDKSLKRIAKKINEQKPDVIIFTGDLYDNYSKYHNNREIINFLSSLKAKKAKIAIYGNHDSGGGGRYPYKQIMAASNFKLLVNQEYSFNDKGKEITIYGLDDALLGVPVWQQTSGDYKILLTHEPDIGYQTDEDLILSGHTHGGQIKLPFVSGKTNLMGDYVRGLYKQNGQYHYIDSGLGMTRLPFRFGVPPQISTITIKL